MTHPGNLCIQLSINNTILSQFHLKSTLTIPSSILRVIRKLLKLISLIMSLMPPNSNQNQASSYQFLDPIKTGIHIFNEIINTITQKKKKFKKNSVVF